MDHASELLRRKSWNLGRILAVGSDSKFLMDNSSQSDRSVGAEGQWREYLLAIRQVSALETIANFCYIIERACILYTFCYFAFLLYQKFWGETE